MENITFDSLPQEVRKIKEKLDLLINLSENKNNSTEDLSKRIGITEAADFLGISKPTLYAYTSQGRIPFEKPPGTKRIYFKKKDLVAWLEDGRRLTNKEAINQAGRHIKQRKK